MSEYQYKKLFHLPLVPGISVYFSSRVLTAICGFFFFYFMAGESGSQSLYLLSSAIVAAIAIGILLPFLQILDTKVAIMLPAQAVAGEQITIGLRASHAFLTGVLAKIFPLRLIALTIDLSKQTGQIISVLDIPAIADGIGQQASIEARTVVLKRGFYTFRTLRASTCFPFAMCWWSTKLPVTLIDNGSSKNTLTVYPQLKIMSGQLLQNISMGNTTIGKINERSHSLQESCSVRGLRPYRQGDSPRWINWKSTARSGRLIIKEFDNETEPDQLIMLDTDAAWQTDEQFELAVCLANSIVQNPSSMAIRRLLVPPSKFVNDVLEMPQGLERSREILARVQFESKSTAMDYPSRQASSLARLQTLFSDTLKTFPNSLVFAVIPGEDLLSVNLVKITLNEYGRPSHRVGIAQNHHQIASTSMVTGQQSIVTLEQPDSKNGRAQIIASISNESQISFL